MEKVISVVIIRQAAVFKWCSFLYQGDQNYTTTNLTHWHRQPCFHAYAKFWPGHPNVTGEIKTHQTRRVSNLQFWWSVWSVRSWQQWLHVHRCSSTSAAPGFRLLCVNYRDPEVSGLWSSHSSPSGTNNHIQNHICTAWLPHDLHLCRCMYDCIWSVFNP